MNNGFLSLKWISSTFWWNWDTIEYNKFMNGEIPKSVKIVQTRKFVPKETKFMQWIRGSELLKIWSLTVRLSEVCNIVVVVYQSLVINFSQYSGLEFTQCTGTPMHLCEGSKNKAFSPFYKVHHSKVNTEIWLKSIEKMDILTFLDYFHLAKGMEFWYQCLFF